jgi:hypothetical protein
MTCGGVWEFAGPGGDGIATPASSSEIELLSFVSLCVVASDGVCEHRVGQGH